MEEVQWNVKGFPDVGLPAYIRAMSFYVEGDCLCLLSTDIKL